MCVFASVCIQVSCLGYVCRAGSSRVCVFRCGYGFYGVGCSTGAECIMQRELSVLFGCGLCLFHHISLSVKGIICVFHHTVLIVLL